MHIQVCSSDNSRSVEIKVIAVTKDLNYPISCFKGGSHVSNGRTSIVRWLV